MTNVEKMNKAAEKLARANQDAAQTVMDHTIGLGERNVRFAQGMVDSSAKEIRQQAESQPGPHPGVRRAHREPA